jgi:glycosyltransferase involved in cell wall biosynthesis
MQITISVGGRFHAFNLAEQLLKRGYLQRLITSYPKFEVVKYGIPRNKIKSVVVKELIERSWRKQPEFLRNSYNPQYLIHEIFDRLASRAVKPTDIFVGWSSFSLHSLKKAKKLGAIAIIERGSSHIVYQNEIIKEEYEKFGLKPQLPHPKIIEKELKEYQEADYISIPSSFVKRTFLEQGIPESKLLVTPYGVDLSAFRQIPKKDKVFRVVFVGGMTLRKGIHYLLQAFSELDLPNSELILIGSLSNEIKPFFKKYGVAMSGSPTTRGGRASQILYLGHKPQGQLYKYYSQSSVFAIMSVEEGMAMVQLEAMACGLPVICATNTGGEDVVRNGIEGFVIPIRDIRALKERLVYLYEDPKALAQMSRNAKKRVSSGFTWDDYGKKIIKTYQKILA